MVITVDILIIILLIFLLVSASFLDIRIYRIPNILTYSYIFLGFTYNSYIFGYEGFIFSMLGTLAGIGLLFIPYILGWMGAGDAKLLGAVGSFIGANGVFISFLFTALAGGIYALLIIILYNSKFKGFFTNLYYSGVHLFVTQQYVSFEDEEDVRQRPKLCYGLAIAAGTGIYMFCMTYGIEVLPL